MWFEMSKAFGFCFAAFEFSGFFFDLVLQLVGMWACWVYVVRGVKGFWVFEVFKVFGVLGFGPAVGWDVGLSGLCDSRCQRLF